MAKTTRGKNVMTFGVFLLISTLFWFFMTMNEDVSRDFRMPVKISDIPQGTTLLTLPPEYIEVTVTDKGRSFLRFDWGKDLTVNLKYTDFQTDGKNRIILSEKLLKSIVRDRFGTGAMTSSCRPDSLVLAVTDRPGVKLPVIADVEAYTEPQYTRFGNIRVAPDSVTVYSANGIPSTVTVIKTQPLSLRNLSDTTITRLTLSAPQGMRVIPNEVEISVPVEPLVAKTKNVNIAVRNCPRGQKLMTFPASVEISCLLPMSLYNTESFNPKAYVDYKDIVNGSHTLDVKVSPLPEFYQSVTVSPLSVEYTVEQL